MEVKTNLEGVEISPIAGNVRIDIEHEKPDITGPDRICMMLSINQAKMWVVLMVQIIAIAELQNSKMGKVKKVKLEKEPKHVRKGKR